MEGVTRKDNGLEAAMRSMAESSALFNKTLATGLQFMFSAMQRPGNIGYQSQTHLDLLQTIGFISLNSPPFTRTHTCQPPGNIQNSTILTILTLMGALIYHCNDKFLNNFI